jgi:hypothetical protein
VENELKLWKALTKLGSRRDGWPDWGRNLRAGRDFFRLNLQDAKDRIRISTACVESVPAARRTKTPGSHFFGSTATPGDKDDLPQLFTSTHKTYQSIKDQIQSQRLESRGLAASDTRLARLSLERLDEGGVADWHPRCS